MSPFLPQLIMRKGKSINEVSLNDLLHVEEKFLEIHEHYWLSITWILKRITPYKLWTHFTNQTTFTAQFCTKFTTITQTLLVLNILIFYSNNCLVPLQILSYQELDVVAPVSSRAKHKKSFSFSWLWLAKLILILKSNSQSRLPTKNNQ